MSDEPSKCTNYLRIVRLVVDIGTETVRNLFFHFKPRNKVQAFFQSQTICDELNDLRRHHRLTREQFDRLVFEPDPNPDEFDLSLLLMLLTNLFKITIEKPINGWDKHVHPDDATLGGDLLRLKNIRNKIIGHRPNAELSSSEFEELWTQTENVLLRITEFVDSTKKEEIAGKISDYKTNALDETCDRKYLLLLNTWHEEAIKLLSHLTKEVEMLCESAEGFDIFFRSKIPERYLRYILLLCEGGLSVLAGVMKRELERHQTSLADVLMQNKQTLIAFNTCAAPVIFTEDDKIVTDISFWGLKLLSYVILMLFHTNLSSLEQTAIAAIGAACNDYGKIAMESLDSDKFRTHWTNIVFNINIIAHGLDDETRMETLMLIKRHDTEKVDEGIAKQYLMQLRRSCEPLQSLVEQYIELREKLKQAVEQMQSEGACFGKDQVIELKMMTFGKTEEKRELAENILYKIWQAAVTKTGGSTDFPVVKAAVEQILRSVYDIPGITTVDVEKHCIILTLTCTTCESLKILLDVVARPILWKYMKLASRELSYYYEERIVITAFITAESMQSTLESLGDENEERSKGISLKFGCSSVADTENVRNLFQRNETSNSINQMAEALSDQLNEKISITTALQDGGKLDIYSNPFDMVSESQWTDFVLPADIAVEEQVPDFSHLQHLRGVLDGIKTTPSSSATSHSTAETSFSKEEIYFFEFLHERVVPFGQAPLEQERRRRSYGPDVNWDEYEIPKKVPKRSPCSSFGSFASFASNQSLDMNQSFI